MRNINLIWAQDNERCIGKDNKIPWNLPEDLKRFKTLTKASSVIMGRKTWDSLPQASKPLSFRHNFIITQNKNYINEHPDVTVVHDFEFMKKVKNVWIIGGASLYNYFINEATNLYVTNVHTVCNGDTFAPEIDESVFRIDRSSPVYTDAQSNLQFNFVDYIRR